MWDDSNEDGDLPCDGFPEEDIEGPATGEAPYKPDIAYTEGSPIMVGPLITELPPLVLSVDESPA